MQPYLLTHISWAFFIKRVDKVWNNQRKLIWIENHLRGPDFNRKHGTSISYLLLNWEEVDGYWVTASNRTLKANEHYVMLSTVHPLIAGEPDGLRLITKTTLLLHLRSREQSFLKRIISIAYFLLKRQTETDYNSFKESITFASQM